MIVPSFLLEICSCTIGVFLLRSWQFEFFHTERHSFPITLVMSNSLSVANGNTYLTQQTGLKETTIKDWWWFDSSFASHLLMGLLSFLTEIIEINVTFLIIIRRDNRNSLGLNLFCDNNWAKWYKFLGFKSFIFPCVILHEAHAEDPAWKDMMRYRKLFALPV